MPEMFAVPNDDAPELPAGPFAGTDDALAAGAGLTLPRIFVRPAYGDPFTVQAYNPDMLAFEDTAAKHRWKGPGEAPFRWLTFLAWSAAKREGLTTLPWEEFKTTTLEIRTEQNEAMHPTRPGPVPG